MRPMGMTAFVWKGMMQVILGSMHTTGRPRAAPYGVPKLSRSLFGNVEANGVRRESTTTRERQRRRGGGGGGGRKRKRCRRWSGW